MNIGLAALAITLSLSFSKMLGWLVKVCCFTGRVGVDVCCLECLAPAGSLWPRTNLARKHARTRPPTPLPLSLSRETHAICRTSRRRSRASTAWSASSTTSRTRAPRHRTTARTPNRRRRGRRRPPLTSAASPCATARSCPSFSSPSTLTSAPGRRSGFAAGPGRARARSSPFCTRARGVSGDLLSGFLGVGRSLACLVPARGHVIVTWLHKDM